MKWRNLYFMISLSVLIPGVVSLYLFGLKPAIDFTGGSLLEVKIIDDQYQIPVDLDGQVKNLMGDEYQISRVQPSANRQFIIRSQFLESSQKAELISRISSSLVGIEELRFERVGPTLGKELLSKTLVAILLASTVITLYVWKQFSELKYGICAILAMFHDSLVLIGAFSIFGFLWGTEVDLLFVTALLTTLSFSIHDTIVVYDRIRELRKHHQQLPLKEIVNAAVIQTLGRSLNNSLTIIIMLLALTLLGGETIRWFSVALLIGAITGTYSSTFTAAPLLLLWDELGQKIKIRFK